jgi:N-acetylmuramoyl-L-alanine amidase
MRRPIRAALCGLWLLSLPVLSHAGSVLTESDLASRYSLCLVSVTNKLAVFRRQDTTFVVENASRRASLGGLVIFLNHPAVCTAAGCGVEAADAATTLDPILFPPRRFPSSTVWTVVLDPGHGGHDTGAISPRKILEKKVTLDIARRVQKHLRGSGVTVRLTRDRDSDVALPSRTAIAQKWNADLLVSIHVNSASNPQADGVETYLCPMGGARSTSGAGSNTTACPGNRFDALNMLLAYRIHGSLVSGSGARDRGIRRARYEVLTTAPCPAVLVECGFLSNRAEESKLLSRRYRDDVAKGIAVGIRSYVTP